MLIIIFIQLLFMILFPCSIFWLIFKRKNRFLIPIIIIILSFVVFYQFKYIWPFDFIFKNETSFGYNLGNYRVNIVQKPGFDYYDTMYEITSKDRGKAIILIDTDDDKWWFPRIEQNKDRIYFLRYGEKSNEKSVYLNLADSALFARGSFYGIISELDFKSLSLE